MVKCGQAYMFCTQCGKEVPANAQFCPSCGQPQGASAAAATVAPASPVQTQPAAMSYLERQSASIGTRFANYLLDCIISVFLIVILTLISVFVFFPLAILLNIFGFVLYYLFFETMWQRTPGKWVTGTKVVMRDGSKPDFKHILGRSFARIIPFEWISFLFNSHPIGWHDYLSGTLVVPNNYTPEDVRQIDVTKQKHSSAVIIFVVIIGGLILVAFIGLIAAILLASLSVARNKGGDDYLATGLDTLSVDLGVYASDTGSYPETLRQLQDDTNVNLAVVPPLSSYHYVRCSPDSYHIAVTLKERPSGPDYADHSAPLCDGDPIDASAEGPCVSGDTGTYCYDITSVGDATSTDAATSTPQ